MLHLGEVDCFVGLALQVDRYIFGCFIGHRFTCARFELLVDLGRLRELQHIILELNAE